MVLKEKITVYSSLATTLFLLYTFYSSLFGCLHTKSEAILNVTCYSYADSLCLSHCKRSESLIY